MHGSDKGVVNQCLTCYTCDMTILYTRRAFIKELLYRGANSSESASRFTFNFNITRGKYDDTSRRSS